MTDFADIFPKIDVVELLKLSKTYNGSDERRIIQAVKLRYPQEVNQCRSVPGYSESKLAAFFTDVILDYARYKMPDLYRNMMLERYMASGMESDVANHFIAGELSAIERKEYYTNGGRKWV
jgi:hypothetical protein